MLVAATLGTSPSVVGDVIQTPTSKVVLIALGLDGSEQARATVDVGSLETPNASAVGGIADRWVVAGSAPPLQPLLQRPQIWVTNAEHGWMWDSLRVFGPQPGSEQLGGASVGTMAIVDAGVVLAGGRYTNTGPAGGLEVTGWLIELGSAGQLVWEYHATEPGESHYRETAVATNAAGQIRTAGVGWTDGVSSTLRSCIAAR